jgi:hypothetical protein
MKALLLAIVCVSFAAGSVRGQGGVIGIYKDAAGTNCNLDDKVPGLTPYYIVHVYTSGATGCRYSAPKPACLLAQYLSDTNMFAVTIGNSQTGSSVGYGNCRVGPILVQMLNYFTMGTTPPCCQYWTCPDPYAESNQIEVVDCNMNLVYGHGTLGIVNARPQCTCYLDAATRQLDSSYASPTNCYKVPVEDTTWGSIKNSFSK